MLRTKRPGRGGGWPIALVGLLLAACSGMPPAGTQAPSPPAPVLPGASAAPGVSDAPSSSPAADPGGSLAKRGFANECPDLSASFDRLNEATYQVFGEQVFQDAQGQARLAHFGLGTAWVVGERLLATNAHVAAAFIESAAQGLQLSRAIAVQSGTGDVVRLVRGYIHPQYIFSTSSPDVALFETEQELPAALPLAARDSVLGLGDEVQIVGFPADVNMYLTVVPGETVPQATSLSGRITARRSFDETMRVTPETLSIYQHQAPTSPGTSGSSIFHCGLVAGINNAGTARLVVTPDGSGQSFTLDRQPAAANNFGIHARYLHDVVEAFRRGDPGAFELPVAASAVAPDAPPGPIPKAPPVPTDVAVPPTGGPDVATVSIVDFAFQPAELTVTEGTTVSWTNTGAAPHTVTAEGVEFDSGPIQPGASIEASFPGAGVLSYFCAIHPQMRGTITVAAGQASPPAQPGPIGLAGRYTASVADPTAAHAFAFVIDENGLIQGTSVWQQTGEFQLAGVANPDRTFAMTDDAPERRGFRRGVYQGVIAADGTISGSYFEQTQEASAWPFSGQRDQ